MAKSSETGLRIKNSLFDATEEDGQTINGGENQQNSTNEQTLNVQHFCARLQDKVTVLFELEPLEPPRNLFSRREIVPSVPMRVVCVIDVSHSMAEPYGSDTKLSKLDRIKLFAKLLINTIGHEDHLSVVTFGTTAEVVFPLKKMSDDAKQQALREIDTINIRGVTNMSAGIFVAIDQFHLAFAKSRNFSDNILLFTDGMANEGITDSAELTREIRKKIKIIKEECHFENDYVIKFSSIATGGFMPELLYNIGQTFSSDAFYFLNEDASMELDLMLPILVKQSTAVESLKISIAALNGVQFDTDHTPQEYMASGVGTEDDAAAAAAAAIKTYFIYDIGYGSVRHISCCLKLPKKHKKSLKAKEVLRFQVSYKDALMCSRSTEKIVTYSEIPSKEDKNEESSVIVVAKHECQMTACRALDTAASLIAKLDRSAAKTVLQTAIQEVRGFFEYVSNDFCTLEESHLELSDWVDKIVANLDKCHRFIGDFAVRWDDVWGRLKALRSSMAREVVSSTGICAEGAELYFAPKVKEKLSGLTDLLKGMYAAMGLSTATLEKYQLVVEELETKLD